MNCTVCREREAMEGLWHFVLEMKDGTRGHFDRSLFVLCRECFSDIVQVRIARFLGDKNGDE